jgi:hypothetical protein
MFDGEHQRASEENIQSEKNIIIKIHSIGIITRHRVSGKVAGMPASVEESEAEKGGKKLSA